MKESLLYDSSNYMQNQYPVVLTLAAVSTWALL